MPRYASRSWTAELGARGRFRWRLKTVLITAGIGLFMLGYFFLLHNPVGTVIDIPSTAFDRAIPFQPAWLVVYVTLWGYVSLGPGFQRDLRALAHYGAWVGAMCLVALFCFRFWPTRLVRDLAETGDFPGFGLLRGLDRNGNTCPSMHVAAAIFTAVRFDAVLRYARAPAALRCLNTLWCAAIVYSTVAIRQHGVWDVACGALLGLAFAVASLKCAPDGVP